MTILGLDGCFIKGHHVRHLLIAIGVDPENQMYLVAYALVESECRETWLWFLELLGIDLELNNSYGIVWIIDKQKGLTYAIRELFPHFEHRLCVKHFYNNFKASHKGLMLKQLLWGATKCKTKQGWNYVYQVKENGGDQFMVNIEQKSCSWNKWQLIGILCIHRMTALLTSNRDPLDS
ncbi:hypothetical protein Ddye_025861 [Dipteronia dyeriana]|uniref:Zinc finger PMZ-type domain-containing protein n=1 Tax=Dipteronia dyeriana TaxID=168575 RepID=A0AAD9TL62_9ROSI|nr:hypothetical protein Ddye_025861 [Dipteronia dyeriana]